MTPTYKISTLTIFLVFLSATGAAQSNAETVAVSEAERRVVPHVKYIEKRAGEMTAAFYYTGAQRTLEESFRKAGVTTSMGYADPWGKGGVGLFWSEIVRQFYEHHLDALNKSLKVIRAKGSATRADLDYLDAGMDAWKQTDGLFQKQFEILADLYTKGALINDEMAASGKTFDARLDEISGAKPFRSDRYDSAKAERERTFKQFDERNKFIEIALQTVKREMETKARNHVFNAIDDKACTTGTERLRPDIKQSRTWVLAESIEFTKGSAAYIQSDKNVLKTLSTAGEVIDKVADIVDEADVPVMKIPMEYFKGITKAGDEIVQAGGRLSSQQKKKLVDLVVKIDLVELTVECVAIEVCEDGKWVRKGMRQNGEPMRKKLRPLIKEEQGVLAGELWQRVDKHTRSYVAMQERFESDPCAGTGSATPSPVDTPKEDCDRILAEIDRWKERRSSIETRDLPRAREEVDRARTNLARWNDGLVSYKESLSKAIVQAENELKSKRTALRLAQEKKTNLEQNPTAPNQEQNIKEAEAAVKKREADVTAAEQKVKDAKKRREQADRETADREATIRRKQEQVDELVTASSQAQVEIDRLQREYAACKR